MTSDTVRASPSGRARIGTAAAGANHEEKKRLKTHILIIKKKQQDLKTMWSRRWYKSHPWGAVTHGQSTSVWLTVGPEDLLAAGLSRYT